jgi:hypothetical protein
VSFVRYYKNKYGSKSAGWFFCKTFLYKHENASNFFEAL